MIAGAGGQTGEHRAFTFPAPMDPSTEQQRASAVDVDWLFANLAVGSRVECDSLPALAQELGVNCVVDVRSEACDDAQLLAVFGIELLHVPAMNERGVSLAMLDRGVAWIRAQLDGGNRVLIHCEQGVGRSALLALCVLVSLGMEPMEAFRYARMRRPRVMLSNEQCRAYLCWLERHASEPGFRWKLPTLEELLRFSFHGT